MRHPIESCNIEQARVLASLPDNQREFWARQFRIGNASYCYQAQFSEAVGLEAARLTFNRLPVDAVQAGFLKQLPDLVAKYAKLYERKPADMMAVGTISHTHAPNWITWLRLDTDYLVDAAGPVLFINELDELTKAELDPSIAAVHRRDDLINPVQ